MLQILLAKGPRRLSAITPAFWNILPQEIRMAPIFPKELVLCLDLGPQVGAGYSLVVNLVIMMGALFSAAVYFNGSIILIVLFF